MKTYKITALVLSAFIAVSLCGCNNEPQTSGSGSNSTESSSGTSQSQSQVTESNSDSISDNNSESSGETSSDTSTVKEPLEFFGALNDPIDRSEIVRAEEHVYNSKEGHWEAVEIPLDKMDEIELFNVYAGFAYCALPIYPALTDRESEYNEKEGFKDITRQQKSDYIRVKPGDNICGLTVAEATMDFMLSPYGGRTEMRSSNIKLKGSKTIEGYIRILTEPEYATGYDGDIIFVPVGDVQLPVMRLDKRDENGVVFRRIGISYMMEDMIYTNEFSGFFDLGNINETTVDLSDIPNDGSFVKVKATLSDFEMQSTIEWFSNTSAVLESVTRID